MSFMKKAEFEQAFHTYFPALCAYATGIVGDRQAGEDLVEDTFVQLWQRGKGEAIKELRPYLYIATRNACISYLKKLRKHEQYQRENTTEEPIQTESPYQTEMLQVEVIRQLNHALEQLPPQCKKVIRMSFVDNLKSKEIASTLGISVSSVDNHRARGLVLLRKFLGKGVFLFVLHLLSQN
jgi:RNA polymerase sigma-70 factor (family 1)